MSGLLFLCLLILFIKRKIQQFSSINVYGLLFLRLLLLDIKTRRNNLHPINFSPSLFPISVCLPRTSFNSFKKRQFSSISVYGLLFLGLQTLFIKERCSNFSPSLSLPQCSLCQYVILEQAFPHSKESNYLPQQRAFQPSIYIISGVSWPQNLLHNCAGRQDRPQRHDIRAAGA